MLPGTLFASCPAPLLRCDKRLWLLLGCSGGPLSAVVQTSLEGVDALLLPYAVPQVFRKMVGTSSLKVGTAVLLTVFLLASSALTGLPGGAQRRRTELHGLCWGSHETRSACELPTARERGAKHEEWRGFRGTSSLGASCPNACRQIDCCCDGPGPAKGSGAVLEAGKAQAQVAAPLRGREEPHCLGTAQAKCQPGMLPELGAALAQVRRPHAPTRAGWLRRPSPRPGTPASLVRSMRPRPCTLQLFRRGLGRLGAPWSAATWSAPAVPLPVL